MNKVCHKLAAGTVTGWLYTDTILNADCPRCGSTEGYYCTSPKGSRVTAQPHVERMVNYANAVLSAQKEHTE